jgi:hypothetical protein
MGYGSGRDMTKYEPPLLGNTRHGALRHNCFAFRTIAQSSEF